MVADSALVLAKRGADVAMLAVVADGKHLLFQLNEKQVLKIIESAAESLARMRDV